MGAYETLVVERPEDGIAVATLNRPERMNALTFAAFAELHRRGPGGQHLSLDKN